MSSFTDPSIDCANAASTQDPAQNPPETPTIDPPEIQQNSTEFKTFCPKSFPDPQSDAPPSCQTPAPLTSRQQTAISLLTSGHTISSVAATLNLHRTTIHNWKKNPEFIHELTTRQLEIRQASDARLRRLILHATQTALDSLSSKRPDRHQHAFRLLTIMRPYITLLDKISPNCLDDYPPRPETQTKDKSND